MLDTAHADMLVVRGAWQHGPKEAPGGGDREFLHLPIGRAGAIHVGETSTYRPFGEGLVDFKGSSGEFVGGLGAAEHSSPEAAEFTAGGLQGVLLFL